jgi:hypothetical protein
MKYWNKRKQVRQKHWTCVKLRIDDRDRYFTGPYEGWISLKDFDNLKVELQRQQIKNKFYMAAWKKEVWFESGKDATWFTLKYAGIHL